MRKGIFAAAVLLLFLSFCSRQLLAQQLLWDVDFKFGFDNREYASIETEPSSGRDTPCTPAWTRPNISAERHLN